MDRDLISRLEARCVHTGSSKRRAGFGTLVSSLIMVAAVGMLGSVVLIWANSSLNVEKTKISDDFAKSSNLLRETFIVEDIWLSKSPADYVNITLRNIGDISMNVTSVNVTAVDNNGANACGAPCTKNLDLGAIIDIKQTRMIAVGTIDWDHANAKTLNITITTSRGSVEQLFWRVS